MTDRFILGVDIGNTNTVFGLFDAGEGVEILRHWRAVTRRDRTSDELGIFLLGFLETVGVAPERIAGFIYSSVVPHFNPIVERMARDYFSAAPLRVTHESDLPIEIRYPAPAEIGADRLVNASAAAVLYGGPLVVVDLGTATTFCAVKDNAFVGGSIAPGLKLSIESLAARTAQLPPIEFRHPPSGVIGDSTIHALQSGFFYGWAGLVREISTRMKAALAVPGVRIIATGGLATAIHEGEPELFDIVDPLLTLRGLKILYVREIARERPKLA